MIYWKVLINNNMIKNTIVYNTHTGVYTLHRGNNYSRCKIGGNSNHITNCSSECPLFDLKKGSTGECRTGDNPTPIFYTLKLRCAASKEPYMIRIEEYGYEEI